MKGRFRIPRRRFRTAAVILLLALAGAAAYAQPAARHGRVPLTREAQQKLEALRVWRLTQELNLSEDQSARFFPKLKQLRDVREQYRADRKQALAQLGEAVRAEPFDQARVQSLVDSLNVQEDSFHQAGRRLRGELNALLSVEQQARFYLFQANFDQQTRKTIQQIQHERLRRRP